MPYTLRGEGQDVRYRRSRRSNGFPLWVLKEDETIGLIVVVIEKQVSEIKNFMRCKWNKEERSR